MYTKKKEKKLKKKHLTLNQYYKFNVLTFFALKKTGL